MRRSGFTLIEVTAVIALLGLLAGAVAWSMVEDVRDAAGADAVGQIAHCDRMARLTAQRLGQPCLVRFDLDRQSVVRVVEGERDPRPGAAGRALPAGWRIDRVVVPRGGALPGRVAGDATPVRAEAGVVDVRCSTGGRSVSYAVALVGPDEGRRQWIMVSGLTGQLTPADDEKEIENLVAMLVGDRPDAD